MTKTKDQQLLLEARKEYLLTPGRVLNTAVLVSPEVVDVQLTHDAALNAVSLIEEIYPKWNRLYQSNELNEQERQIVDRHMGEISLVAAAVEQVLMEEDNSDEIDSLEQHLYDYYSPELFAQAVTAKIEQIENFKIPEDYEPYRHLVLEKLSQFLPKDQKGEKIIPNETTLRAVSEWLHDQYGDLMQEIDDDPRDEFEAPAIVGYFTKAIASTPILHEYGWGAETIVREKSAISTSAFLKKFIVPTQRTVNKKDLKKLVVHEVLGHGLRAAFAEALGIEIGQFGTASYARFEESLLIALEQCLEGKHDSKRGVDHYVATGLSVTGGFSKEEIASLMGGMSFLGLLEKNAPEQAMEKANNRKKDIINRTFTGMTDVDDGIAHRKDIDYFHGLSDSWKLLNFAVDHNILDQTLRWVMSAKFNPFDASDREYVNQYVSMPKELDALFTNDLT